jgi:flavodoxin
MNKSLIVYFSYTGNTKKIAEYISSKINCDVIEIKTTNPYSKDYNQVVKQGQQEINELYEPNIIFENRTLEKYETIFLGNPIWWYTIAPAVRTFLSTSSLDNKTIIPFITNGGYGLGHSLKDIKELCPNSKILIPFEIPFEIDEMQISLSNIDKWINSLES